MEQKSDVNISCRDDVQRPASVVQNIASVAQPPPSLECWCGYEASCLYKLNRHQQGRNCGSSSTSRMIERSKTKYPECFTYENMEYFKGNITGISCVRHGPFSIGGSNHLKTSFGGCPGCLKRPSFESFVKEANEVHEHQYEYDRNSFVNLSAPVTMTHIPCGKIMHFIARSHICGTGCKECWMTPTPFEPVIRDLSPFRGKLLKHPVHRHFAWDVDKEVVVNLHTGRALNKNRKRRRWYKEVRIRSKQTYEHIFMYECFHGVDATGTQIDHINGDHTDDRIQNLQRLTVRDHARKTSATHDGETAQKIGKTLGRSGTARNPDTCKTIEFESVADLARKLQNHPANIRRFLRTGKSPPHGFSEIVFNQSELLHGEMWKKHPTLSIVVSNHGRVKHDHRITYGSNDTGGYRVYNGKRVHVLVIETFIGMRPSDLHTVDHIDRNRNNNHIDNLRWATPSEQSMNQSNKHVLVQINGFTGQVIARFDNFSCAAAALKTYSKKIHTISGKRDWFIYSDDKTRRLRRIEFVRKRLAMTQGIMLSQTWTTVASGFFENRERVKRSMGMGRGTSNEDKTLFKVRQLAANCIKFHIKSWICFCRGAE